MPASASNSKGGRRPRGQRQGLPLQNSKPRHPHGARRLRTKPADEEIISVTVVVRAPSIEARQKAINKLSALLPHQRKHLAQSEFVKRHGARRKDLALIESFANANGLRVVESSSVKRCVVLSGSIAAFMRAFQVEWTMHHHEGHTYRSYENEIQIPTALHGIVEAVLGLDNRQLMKHHIFLHAQHATHHVNPEEVAEAYDFPQKANGQGQRIAIIELGGGFYASDIEQYFRELKLNQPKIDTVEIDGQRNDPALPDLIKQVLDAMGVTTENQNSAIDPVEGSKALWTIETTLDIELAGSFANGADIIVYFAPNNAQGKYHALTSALHNEKQPPTLISCSWGATEMSLPLDFVHAFDQVLQDAALRGVTICFSSGDRGEDPDKDGKPRVHFPASSPNVLSCGGTHWIPAENKTKEVVWSEKLPKVVAQSGGGVSNVFDPPEWQTSAGVEKKTNQRGRGVPDVAGKADMATGYEMIVGGYTVTMGGTSSVAPMWAGLVARLNQTLGKEIGYLTSFLYQEVCRDAFTDITEGNNGTHFQAGPGWDACTGLGTPNGKKLLAALRGRS